MPFVRNETLVCAWAWTSPVMTMSVAISERLAVTVRTKVRAASGLPSSAAATGNGTDSARATRAARRRGGVGLRTGMANTSIRPIAAQPYPLVYRPSRRFE
ncbi:hypothetical protein LDDCCGHA_2719 [Methylobacterium oxalidis]|nr:hypothetical protein LDDCCGHA_2719 [Methylobacterium oxalidis]